jgi:hypothetical protein
MPTTTTHSKTDSQKMRLLVDSTVAILRWNRVCALSVSALHESEAYCP